MFDVVVLLRIKSLSLFHEFETQALQIMKSYGGTLILAFGPRSSESPGKQVDEIHVLQFPDEESFEKYRADPQLASLSDLRALAILETEVYVAQSRKIYDMNDT